MANQPGEGFCIVCSTPLIDQNSNLEMCTACEKDAVERVQDKVKAAKRGDARGKRISMMIRGLTGPPKKRF